MVSRLASTQLCQLIAVIAASQSRDTLQAAFRLIVPPVSGLILRLGHGVIPFF